MEFGYYNDPGVSFRNRKRDTTLLKKLHELDKTPPEESDSIVQRWRIIFEKIWYVGHIYIMTVSLVSILLCITRQVLKPWPRLIYRSTFVGVVITYSISLLQNLNGAEPGFYALLPLGTFQNIILASFWIFTIPHTIKLIPFALYSLLHVADTASEHHSESKRRSKISQGLNDRLVPVVLKALGYLDLWFIVELIRDCLLIRPGAIVSLIVFLFFYRVRLMYSPLSRDAFYNCYKYADRHMSRKEVPKKPRELWIRLRNKIEPSAVKASDLYREDTEKAIEYANIFHTLKK